MGLNYKIIANDTDITSIFEKNLIEGSVSDESGFESDNLTLVLNNSEHDIKLPARGAEIELWLGYDSLDFIGLFIVDEIDFTLYPSTYTIKATGAPFAKSNVFKALQNQLSRSFDDVSLPDIVKTIAKEHGLDAVVGQDFSSILISHLDQINESNINLLQRLAQDYGGFVKATLGKLIFMKPAQGKSASGQTLDKILITPDDIQPGLSGSFGEVLKYKSVVAKYNDLDTALQGSVTAGTGEPTKILKKTYLTENGAKKAAQANLAKSQKNSGNINLSFNKGRTDIKAESIALLSGFPININGDWNIKKVDIKFGNGAFDTSCELEATT